MSETALQYSTKTEEGVHFLYVKQSHCFRVISIKELRASIRTETIATHTLRVKIV